MKKLSLALTLFGAWLLAFSLQAQTDPDSAYRFVGGSYSLTSWSSANGAGTNPPAGRFQLLQKTATAASGDATITTPATADFNCTFGSTSGSRIQGQNANGFSFTQTSSTTTSCGQGTNVGIGQLVLSINTAGRSSINVKWTGRMFSNFTYGAGSPAQTIDRHIRLQARVGNSGAWNNILNGDGDTITFRSVIRTPSLAYRANGSSQAFDDTLPAMYNNQQLVQLRWVYYAPAGVGGTNQRPTIGVDDIEITPLSNLAPVLSGISPNTAPEAGSGFTLTATGSDFSPSSVIRWNGSPLATTFVSGTTLTATVPASLIATAGTPTVTVFTPTPGGGTSAGQTFTVVSSSAPAVTPSVTSLTFSGLTSATQVSASLSYTLNAANLTGDVDVTAPANFQISRSASSGFSNSLVISSADAQAGTTIFVRFAPGAAGSLSGNITHVSPGAATANVSVSGNASATYYLQSTTNPHLTSNWTLNADGTGPNPANFTTANQTFVIDNSVTFSTDLTVSGTGSSLIVDSTGTPVTVELEAGADVVGPFVLEGGNTLRLNEGVRPSGLTCAVTSTVHYRGVDPNTLTPRTFAVPSGTYGNLFLEDGNLTLAAGNTFATNFTVEGITNFNGSGSPFSTLNVAGDFSMIDGASFVPNPAGDGNRLTLQFTRAGLHTLTADDESTPIRVFRLATTVACSVVVVAGDAPSKTALIVGNNAGGGVTLLTGSVLNMNGNSLQFVGNSQQISGGSNNGDINLTNSDLIVNTNNALATIGLRLAQAPTTINSLVINRTGAGKNVSFNAPIWVKDFIRLSNGTLQAGVANVVLLSTATSQAYIDTVAAAGNIAGTITVQRYITPTYGPGVTTGVTSLVGSPVNVNLSSFENAGTNPFNGFPGVAGVANQTRSSVYVYNPTNGWVKPSAITEPMTPGKGASIFFRKNFLNISRHVILTGAVTIANPSYTIPVTHCASGCTNGMSFNLVANPLPAAINWLAPGGWSKTGIDNRFYIYRNDIVNYGVYDADINDSTNNISRFIALGQAFFVATNSATPDFRITEKAKITSFRSLARQGVQEKFRIALAKNGVVGDEAVVRLDVNSTRAYDAIGDAPEMEGGWLNVSTEPISGSFMAINSMNVTQAYETLRMRVTTTETGTHTLTFTGLSSLMSVQDVYLLDRFTNTRTRLMDGTTYSFSVSNNPASQGNTRFELEFGALTTSLSSAINQARLSVYPNPSNGQELFVELNNARSSQAQVLVYDAVGKLAFSTNITTASEQVIRPDLSAGVYTLTVVDGDTRYTERLVIQ